mgnify:FL=1
MIEQFVKKPIIVEAVQWTGKNEHEIMKFVGSHCCLVNKSNGKALIINTLEGDHYASVNDWIVKGVKGEFYPVKPDIMEQTYNRVN